MSATSLSPRTLGPYSDAHESQERRARLSGHFHRRRTAARASHHEGRHQRSMAGRMDARRCCPMAPGKQSGGPRGAQGEIPRSGPSGECSGGSVRRGGGCHRHDQVAGRLAARRLICVRVDFLDHIRNPRRLQTISTRAWRAGAATAAGGWACPWAVAMIFTHPASAIAGGAPRLSLCHATRLAHGIRVS